MCWCHILLTNYIILRTERNCLRFYGSDAKCESAPCYVQRLDRACVACLLQTNLIKDPTYCA
jgi:hypothetical protein